MQAEVTTDVITVLAVDDHALHRDGIRQILGQYPGIQVVGEANSAEIALALVKQLSPSLVLMDIRLPGMNGIDATRRIRQDHPGTRVLVVTAYDDDEYVRGALEAGASGHLSKAAPGRDSCGTVNEVNSATTRLFGPVTPGAPCQDLLSAAVPELLRDKPPYLSLATSGGRRLFVPTARTLAAEDDECLVQIVLTDVTGQQRRQEEQQAFSGRLLAVQEEQRRQLAQELHDDPLQNLMYLTRTLEEASEDVELPARHVPTMRHGGELAAEAATALRKIIHGLRPPVPDDIGVVPAIRQLVAEAGRRGGLPVGLRHAGTEDSLSSELKLTVYRIVQESLNNVVRHAEASHATVSVRFGDPLTLTISDDGRGITRFPEQGNCPQTGLGLIGMRERATLAGGTLRVSTRPPHGTIVSATLPHKW